MKQPSKRFFQFQQKFSIRKFKIGVASVAISTMAIGLSLTPITAVYAEEGDFNRTGTGDSTVIDAQEFVMVTHEKPGGVVEDVAILKSKFSENLDQLKKDYPGFTATNLQLVGKNKYKITYVPVTTTNQPSSTTESAANTGDTGTSNSTSATTNPTQPSTDNKVSLQGNLVGKQNEYNVGNQIISTFRLDVSAPSKLEEGSYILVTLPENEPITDVQFGTALKVEKVNDTQYKIYTGEVPSGSFGNFNISYKFDKYRTGRNSRTTITSQVMDKNGNPISPEKNTKSIVTNKNKTGYASIHVDSESGARELALFNTNAPGDTIDETKNKELVLKLTTLNKEVAAVNKIQHAITLPTGAIVSETSINAGWTQEGNIARYTRNIPDAKPVFDQGNNTSDDTVRINMRQAGTLEEFLKGKEFTFTDNVTYTDKSGETNTSQGATTLVVKAVNPYKDNGGGAKPDSAGAQPPLVINNFTNEQNYENRVNIAIPGINTETDDKRIIVFWRSVDTPTKVKEVELTIDSDFDQKRSIEFYGIWNKNTAYAAWYAPDDIGTSNTFEVYSVNGTTETKLGEIAFKKNGGTSIDLPEGTTKVVLKPKGEMTFTNDTLSQAGIYLHQNLKGLDTAKQMVAEGKEAKSIVTAKISTRDTDVVNTSISKTILADARTALKLTSRTGKIETVLAGNKTQSLSSGIEAYNYSPSGLGNRVYNTSTSHQATTDKKLDYLGAKNAKIIVELPDGFTYAGNSPLVTKDDNYQNTGKRVLIIDPKDSNTRENVTPNLEFNVAQWVQTGSYPLKYTLVWDESKFLHGLNPNDEFDGDKKIINTSTFTYEVPVSNTSASRLHVDVTDKNDQREGYTTSLQNLAPKADVTYRFTLSNKDNSKLANNEVLVTLPKKGDKNIVDTSIARNSAFDVEATGEAIVPAGWTAYYLTSPINGNANEVATATTLTADQVTDWSKVTAVKFVSNPGTTLNPGLSNEFLLPARISKDAKDKQVANITAAAKTDTETIFNEANTASLTIKIEDIKNGTVKVAYEDMQGNTIKPTITAIEKRAYSKDYNVDTEEYHPDELTGDDGVEYRYMRVKESSAPVEGVVNSEEITVTYVYDTLYENVPETKTITRTIKYVDASDETTEVSPKVVQTVKLTRTNKRNKVTNALEEGTWTQESWEEQASPTVANYGTPDKTSVSLVEVTPTMENAEVVVKYPQATEDEVETKVITRTIKYVDASDENTEVSPKVVQTVKLTRTNKRNKVTKALEEGTWTQESWAEQSSPTVANYGTPDKTSVSSMAVTPAMENAEVVVKYPQAKEDEVETKVITRTIKYVDVSDETKEVSSKVVQTVTLTRTNKRNKVTKALEEGTWSTASWAEQASPTVANYGTPDKESVASVAVTPTMENAEIVVKYPQAKEDEVETKVITRTIKYVDASDETTEVSPKVEQTVTLTRTNKRNKVTKALEEGTWSTASWAEQASPTVANYGTPDKESVASVAVTPTMENAEVVVKYPQAKEDEVETKTITRTIKYVDASNETTEVSPKVVQTVTLTRTNKRNKVTNKLEEGTWTQGSWEEQSSPTVTNYGTPDKASVASVAVTPTMENAEVVVKYPQATEDEVETKVITRTIKYVDASNETTEVSPKVEQTVTLTRTNKRNKVTNKLEEGTWTQGSWEEQSSPTVTNYGTPDKASVASVAVTPTMENAEVVVKYPQAKEDEKETKVITRTIKYVDGADEITEVSPKVVQTVTLTRTNKRNKVTNALEEGTWTQGSWEEQSSPTVTNYGTPDKASVASVAVTPTMENAEVVVKYPQATKDEVETKVITRTINYLEKGTNKVLKASTVQSVTLTRTKTTNKVTNEVTYGEWSKGNWSEVTPGSIDNYKAPSVTRVEATEVTSTTENGKVDVYYEADTKPEPKPEPKPESKPEPKPEPKSESKPEPKPEPKSESKPEPKPEPKAEPKPELKSEPKSELNSEPKIEQQPDTKPGENQRTNEKEEKTKEILPNTGTATFGTVLPAIVSLLSGVGIFAKKKKEDE